MSANPVRLDDGETLDPRYGAAHAISMNRCPQVVLDGLAHPVPTPVWEAVGQLMHSDIELKRKIKMLRAQATAVAALSPARPLFDGADIYVLNRLAEARPDAEWAKCWIRIQPLVDWAIEVRPALSSVGFPETEGLAYRPKLIIEPYDDDFWVPCMWPVRMKRGDGSTGHCGDPARHRIIFEGGERTMLCPKHLEAIGEA